MDPVGHAHGHLPDGSLSNGHLRDEDLPAFAEGLGLPGLFDVHVHAMHPKVLAKVWAYFDAAGPLLGRPWPITYRWDDPARAAHLRMMGVRRWSALSYAHKPGVAGFMNDWNVQFAAAYPDSLWSATFYPEPGVGGYVGESIAAGVEIFKAHVQVGDFPANHPLLEPVWAQLAESGVPVVLHAGSGPAPGTYTGVEGVADVLSRHPEVPLIIAHLGMPEIAGFVDLAERYEHVKLDTTMVFVDFFPESRPEALEPGLLDRIAALGDHILFGTDFPNIPYRYAHQVEALVRAGFDDDWLRRVLWHNGHELFGPGRGSAEGATGGGPA